jgi:cell division septal protein FtsQ
MAKPKKETAEERSWRELDQSVNPRTMSASGRRRLACAALRVALFVTMGAGLIWGGTEILQTLTSDGSAMRDPTQAAPLREIVLVNDADGVLTQEWVERTLKVRLGMPLLEVDLGKLRDRLLAVRQIRAVELRRDFPGTLTITLRERQPVLRMNLQVGDGEARTMLVSRDGVIYEGFGYEPSRLARLPFLDGVRLVHNRAGGFQPIEGMDDVANLLQAAENSAPLLYADWKIVSLARLGLYDEIVVKSRTIPEVVVSRKLDFTQQLARLDYIADYARTQPEATVQRIDLSLGGDVPVSFDHPASRLLPPSSVKPSKSKTSRDL